MENQYKKGKYLSLLTLDSSENVYNMYKSFETGYNSKNKDNIIYNSMIEDTKIFVNDQ